MLRVDRVWLGWALFSQVRTLRVCILVKLLLTDTQKGSPLDGSLYTRASCCCWDASVQPSPDSRGSTPSSSSPSPLSTPSSLLETTLSQTVLNISLPPLVAFLPLMLLSFRSSPSAAAQSLLSWWDEPNSQIAGVFTLFLVWRHRCKWRCLR